MAKMKNEYLYTTNTFYHIYNRGNRKKLIFWNTKDHLKFIEILHRYEKEYDLTIYAYCLMPNHYHFLIRLGSEVGSISKFMHRCMTAYGMYFNKKYQLVGRLCQSPFQAVKLVTVKSIIREIQYIEANPKKAGLVKVSSDYRWLNISLQHDLDTICLDK